MSGNPWREPGEEPSPDPYAGMDIPPPPEPPGVAQQQPSRPPLEFQTLADLCAEVDAAGPRRWLIRGIWPQGAYGVHAAEPKVGKTWNALDLAVSVASGTPWLGLHDVDTKGPVVVFAGEGGRGNLVRRLRAIATARDVIAESLPIVVCARAPRLADQAHIDLMAQRLNDIRPVLVVLDPLYLAAGGANGGSLYEMGGLLERPQHLCERIGASLCVVHHHNRQRDVSGAARMSGAGPAEWGRVLIAGEFKSRSTDQETRATTVVTELQITGGEVPDQTVRLRRIVRALDPDDLDSPMEYRVDEPDDVPAGTADSDLSPATAKALEALIELGAGGHRQQAIGDAIANRYGTGLRRETLSRSLGELERRGLAESVEDPTVARGRFPIKLWQATDLATV